jgi:TatD DNase family protein
MSADESSSVAPLVDAHFHLDLSPDPAAMAHEIEATQIHTIAVTNAPSVFFHTRALSQGCRFLHPAVGLHPELVADRAGEIDSMWPLLEKTRFIGEVGLDYVTKDEAERRLQRDVFGRILERCAPFGNKIVAVHSRRSAKDVIPAVGDAFPGKVILHWFSGTPSELDQAASQGLYFSVNAAMTLSRSGQALIARIPRERTLTETDGPFVELAGHPAQPKDVARVIDFLSRLWDVPLATARKTVAENFARLLQDSGGKQSA